MMLTNYCNYIEKGIRLKLYSLNNEAYIFTKPCCHMTHDLIPTEISKFTKLDSIDVTDIMNIEPMQYYRNYFENNEGLHPACVSCINYESKGLESPRLSINKVDNKDYDINRLDVVLGNSCNLACPFCSSHASSLIEKLSNKLDRQDRPAGWIPLKEVHDFDQPQANHTSATIAEILKHYKVHTLKLIGGEPFLKENWDGIADVIDKGYCNDLHLEITTNGTIINDKIINSLAKVKSVNICISVDSVGNNYDFIRWPHSWGKMYSNLNYLNNKDLNNIRVILFNLVNIFNFEYLPQIEKIHSELKYPIGWSCEMQPITHLQNYQNLPAHIINYVKSQIKTESLQQALLPLDHNHSKESLKKEFEVLLTQRNMKAKDVIGPMTREYFEL